MYKRALAKHPFSHNAIKDCLTQIGVFLSLIFGPLELEATFSPLSVIFAFGSYVRTGKYASAAGISCAKASAGK